MHPSNKKINTFARISLLIIFLALLRNLAEPFRLKYHATESLRIEQVEPFMVGALECTIGLLLMVILFLNEKPKGVILVAILTIISMVIAKIIYGV